MMMERKERDQEFFPGPQGQCKNMQPPPCHGKAPGDSLSAEKQLTEKERLLKIRIIPLHEIHCCSFPAKH